MTPTYPIGAFFEKQVRLQDFHINKLEEMPPLPASIKSPHKHAFVEIFLLTDGEMIHNVDFNQFDVKSNSLFFISQGQLHIWSKTVRQNLRGYRLMFSESFFDNLFVQTNFLFELVYLNNIYHTPLLEVSPARHKNLFLYFQLLQDEYNAVDTKPKALQANLYLLLLEIQRIVTRVSKSGIDLHHLKIYQQFISLVESKFHLKWSTNDFANELNLSPTQLSRIVQKYAQVPIGKVIQNRIILEAKRHLTTTPLSVNEISFKVGIEDPSYFVRVFKKSENITPQEFRKSMA